MGNILNLQRLGLHNNHTYDVIDDLSYTYNGNQVVKIDDDAVDPVYNGCFNFKDGADEDAEYEYDQKVKELETREREFNLAQNKLEASKVMANRGLPIEFVDYIVAEDADTMLENINTFEKAFKAAVADAVTKKIASPSPKESSIKQTGLTKDEFKKMTLAQQAELYHTNPALYKELTQN